MNFLRTLGMAAICTALLSYGSFTFIMSQVQSEELVDRGTFSRMTSRDCATRISRCEQDKRAIAELQESGEWDAYMQHPFLMADPVTLYVTAPLDYFQAKSRVLQRLDFDRTAKVITQDAEGALTPFLRLQHPSILLATTLLAALCAWLLSMVINRKQRGPTLAAPFSFLWLLGVMFLL